MSNAASSSDDCVPEGPGHRQKGAQPKRQHSFKKPNIKSDSSISSSQGVRKVPKFQSPLMVGPKSDSVGQKSQFAVGSSGYSKENPAGSSANRSVLGLSVSGTGSRTVAASGDIGDKTVRAMGEVTICETHPTVSVSKGNITGFSSRVKGKAAVDLSKSPASIKAGTSEPGNHNRRSVQVQSGSSVYRSSGDKVRGDRESGEDRWKNILDLGDDSISPTPRGNEQSVHDMDGRANANSQSHDGLEKKTPLPKVGDASVIGGNDPQHVTRTGPGYRRFDHGGLECAPESSTTGGSLGDNRDRLSSSLTEHNPNKSRHTTGWTSSSDFNNGHRQQNENGERSGARRRSTSESLNNCLGRSGDSSSALDSAVQSTSSGQRVSMSGILQRYGYHKGRSGKAAANTGQMGSVSRSETGSKNALSSSQLASSVQIPPKWPSTGDKRGYESSQRISSSSLSSRALNESLRRHAGAATKGKQAGTNTQRSVGAGSHTSSKQRRDRPSEWDRSAAGISDEPAYLAICSGAGSVGAAVYDNDTGMVRILPDMVETPVSYPVLHSLMAEVQPAYVLISRNAQFPFKEAVKTLCGVDGAPVTKHSGLAEMPTRCCIFAFAIFCYTSLLDMVETPVWYPVLHSLMAEVQPAYVLISRNAQFPFKEAVKTLCGVDGGASVTKNSGRANGPTSQAAAAITIRPRIQYMAPADFALDTANAKVSQLLSAMGKETTGFDAAKQDRGGERPVAGQNNLDGNGGMCDMDQSERPGDQVVPNDFSSADGRSLRHNMTLDPTAKLAIRAFGALLKFIDLKLVGGGMGMEFGGNSQCGPILGIGSLKLRKLMTVDQNTIESLQIFVPEFHPSAFKVGSAFKEGLSMFSLASKTSSAPGYAELRRWFSRPLTDHEELQKRYDAVSFLKKDSTQEIVAGLRQHLKPVKALTNIMKKLKNDVATVSDWWTLFKTVHHCFYIEDRIRKYSSKLRCLERRADSDFYALETIGLLLERTIHFEDSFEEGKIVMKPGLDTKLDQSKRIYRGLPKCMSDVARQEMATLSSAIPECSVSYIPMIGYLLVIPRQPDWETEQDCALENLEYVFTSNNMVHYKSMLTRDLDSQVGDIKFAISDQESELTAVLRKKVLAAAELLVDAVHNVAQLDCLIALGALARERNYVMPTLTERSVIHIERGRHPIVEAAGSFFVPNSTRTGGDDGDGRVYVFTGPNASGKSVYLKQVGLIVYLAHVGSFVPASSAEIGPVDRIFTRVHTLDSVQDGLSTFAADVAQMSKALVDATSHSLIIVDEFGNGTLTEVGLSLLLASTEHWLNMGATGCPHVLIASHLHSILHMLPKSPLLVYKTMEVYHEQTKLTFLHRVIDGKCECSYAGCAALVAGLPSEVVDRSVNIFHSLRMGDLIERIQPTNVANADAVKTRMANVVDEMMNNELDEMDCSEFLKRVTGEH